MEFLHSLPAKAEAEIVAVLRAVADAPPPSFSGGGKWEAMHDDMAGFYEIRVRGADRRNHRLFCLLERNADDLGGSSIVCIDGLSKSRSGRRPPHRTIDVRSGTATSFGGIGRWPDE